MNTFHPTTRCATGAGLVRALAVRGLGSLALHVADIIGGNAVMRLPLDRGMSAISPITRI
jgi:hypothetical protein